METEYIDIDAEFFKQVIAMNTAPKKSLTLAQAAGQAIRNLRHEHSMTLRDLAEATYIALGHISDVERGVKNMFLDSYADVAKVFGLTNEEFFDEIIKAQQGKVVNK